MYTDLAVEQVTVRIQEPKREPLRSNDPCIEEFSLKVNCITRNTIRVYSCTG